MYAQAQDEWTEYGPFSETARGCLASAAQQAEAHWQCLGTGYLLVGLLDDETGFAAEVFASIGVMIRVVAERLRQRALHRQTDLIETATLTDEVKSILQYAGIARNSDAEPIGVTHILMGFLFVWENPSLTRVVEPDGFDLLVAVGATPDQLRQAIQTFGRTPS